MSNPETGGDARHRLTHERMMGLVPFAGVGAELVSAAPERVEGRLAWSPKRCTAGSVLHGGALMVRADTMGAVCAFLTCLLGPRRARASPRPTFRVRPKRPRRGHLQPAARGALDDRVVQTDLFDADGRRVAQTTQTQAVIGGEHDEA